MVCVGWKGVRCLLSAHQSCCNVCGGSGACRVALCCVLWNGGGGGCVVSCLSSLFPYSLLLPLLLPLCVGVRGSARAALRARTLSPNTIASSFVSSSLSLLLLAFSVSRLSSAAGMAVGDSPCVGVFGGHDGYG